MDSRKLFSVKPMFEMLAMVHSGLGFIHRFVATRVEFEHYLTRWTQKRHASYPILYIALHGTTGNLELGRRGAKASQITISDVGQLLAGQCARRVVHFASCDTLDVEQGELVNFLKVTGAAAVSGYQSFVPMIESTAFDMLMLNTLQEHAFDGNGIKAIDRKLDSLAPSLRDSLNFRFEARLGNM